MSISLSNCAGPSLSGPTLGMNLQRHDLENKRVDVTQTESEIETLSLIKLVNPLLVCFQGHGALFLNCVAKEIKKLNKS